MVLVGQSLMLEKSTKTSTSGLDRVCAVRLGGWGPRGPPKRWLGQGVIQLSALVSGVLAFQTFSLLLSCSVYYFGAHFSLIFLGFLLF